MRHRSNRRTRRGTKALEATGSWADRQPTTSADDTRLWTLLQPPPTQPDHLALLLEYASLLVESGDPDAYVRFLEDHLDWLPAFRQLVAEAAADAPFYRPSVALVCDTVAVERERLDVSDPEPGTIETMVDRAQGGMDDEKAFRE